MLTSFFHRKKTCGIKKARAVTCFKDGKRKINTDFLLLLLNKKAGLTIISKIEKCLLFFFRKK